MLLDFECVSTMRSIRTRRGFTLIEAALTTVIIGVGVLAAMQLFAAVTMQNNHSQHMTTAMMLGTNVQEAMSGLAFTDPVAGRNSFGPEAGENIANYNDVDDFNGRSFNPPIDATRTVLAELDQFTQSITVTRVNPNSLSTAATSYSGAVRIEVSVSYRPTPSAASGEVYRLSWLRLDR
jgi:prepilin-type N-terminal cleavage/methylation domain-containing protein